MTALTKFPAGQNMLVEPTPQVGKVGPVTLALGADFAGVKAPAPQTGKSTKPGKKKHSGSGGSSTVLGGGSQNGPNAVQARNAATNICSGLPRG